MNDSSAPRLAKWPFFLGSILLLALAVFLCFHGRTRISGWEVLAVVACVGVGAAFTIWPYLQEYQSAEKLVETAALTNVVAQVQNIEQLAAQISGATGRWQTVQESADKTARHAKEITEKIATEAKSFTEFLKNANDSEKATLRLEVDKLRRIETEWLQVLVRILDHVHALNRAAAHSRQPNVIEQLGRFQSACHDAARRVGLSPFVAAAEEKFDGKKHQVMDGQADAADGAPVDETLANGYTYQGRLIRPAVVRLRNENEKENDETAPLAAEETATETASQTSDQENELPLG
ncbi:MAG TPA: nucleotide exchange factor GrpE [Candidatus Polarisedimenticolia bacterium]|nr:nucleotide exchange factor GrpE [Candidatus Polarisedimenticolia bacterium]